MRRERPASLQRRRRHPGDLPNSGGEALGAARGPVAASILRWHRLRPAHRLRRARVRRHARLRHHARARRHHAGHPLPHHRRRRRPGTRRRRSQTWASHVALAPHRRGRGQPHLPLRLHRHRGTLEVGRWRRRTTGRGAWVAAWAHRTARHPRPMLVLHRWRRRPPEPRVPAHRASPRRARPPHRTAAGSTASEDIVLCWERCPALHLAAAGRRENGVLVWQRSPLRRVCAVVVVPRGPTGLLTEQLAEGIGTFAWALALNLLQV
mmetsp:Transcript_10286/g.30991  ORF Transcript_10286/g.30991 Transcript_10286/m.30991 type:complete len:265 (-) Transcript_10286:280-1074(-)